MPAHRRPTPAIALGLLFLLAACDDPTVPTGEAAGAAGVAREKARETLRFNGIPVRLGDGHARAYVLVDKAEHGTPVEIGVALSDRALEGLPGGMGMVSLLLPLPRHNPTPYRLVELNWNPGGHEPPGIYDLPHFDVHFYTVALESRNAIDPGDPAYAAKAANLPPAELRPPFYFDNGTAAGLPAALVATPHMGLHWVDIRSPELQAALGNPTGFQPFTRSFLKGSWDGRFIFDEPMVSRAWLLSKRSAGGEDGVEVIDVRSAEHYLPAGFYPNAYRAGYDAGAREFVVALVGLNWRE